MAISVLNFFCDKWCHLTEVEDELFTLLYSSLLQTSNYRQYGLELSKKSSTVILQSVLRNTNDSANGFLLFLFFFFLQPNY